ncbi:MAG: transcriptional regulator, LuxR family [Chthonomonadaceae bacterium]|nr:transcriptional regulator, LuxR family [Chthonomonadaceae bacterium]
MSKVSREPTTTQLHITVFGRFRIEIDGEVLKPHRPPDFRMLAYLLLQHDCPVDRNDAAVCWKKAADTGFWESEARTYLTSAVSTLTSKLGSEGKRLQKPQPQLLLFETTGADLDLLTWEAGLAEGSVEALESIAPLYRRTLLEGWDDPWIQQARKRFRNDYVQALWSAARRETAHCHWKAALQAFTLLFEIDPSNEEALRDHLRLLADRRRFKEMQRLYNAYVRHCESAQEPIDPMTAQRYRELRSAADPHGYNTPGAWLPTPLSRFVPRPIEVQEICDSVSLERLTTLTGTGGVGKTRLAIAAAEEMREEFYDRAWFIDLSELQNPAEVPTQVAHALSLVENANRTATEEIVAFLRSKEALLILDNCEHVLEASARLTTSVLQNCPEMRILATSRESLGIVGESVWRVPSLEFPETSARMRPQMLAKFSAIRLLMERASRPQFPLAIDANNADAIARICRRLDGIPLAIELAAVQVSRRRHSFQQVADNLDESLSFLTEGSTTAPSRQQTLRAAIDWSYRLLTDAEQRVFERLGVFVGGFTEEAACAVCSDALLTGTEVVEAVQALVDKSLVELMLSEDGSRYHLLQTIRQYALERLAKRQVEAPASALPSVGNIDVLTRTCRHHLMYFTAFVEEAERHHRGSEQALWLDRQGREHDNFRAALTWALRNGENETGLRLVGSLAVYLFTRGYHTEAMEWLKEFLDRTLDAPPLLRQMSVHWCGNISYTRGDYAIAHAYFTESLALRELQGDRRSVAVGRASLASASGAMGSHQEALALFESNLRVFKELNDVRNTAQTWHSIAVMAAAMDDYRKAQNAYVQSLRLFREVGDTAHIGLAASNLAGINIRLEDYQSVRPLLAECVTIYRTLQTRPRFVFLLIHYICLAVREQDFNRAATILGFEAAFRERIGLALPPKISEQCQVEADVVRQHLAESRFNAQFAIGAQMTEEEMVPFLLEG